MTADQGEKDTWRAEGYMGDLLKELKPITGESGEEEYPVTFWAYTPPLTVYIGEATLAGAGIVPENGRVVVADIRKDATTPAGVDPTNLEDGGVLPSLDTEYTWLQPKAQPVE